MDVKLLIGITLGQMIMGWNGELQHICQPFIKKELVLSYTQIGFLSFSRDLFTGLMAIPGGIISDLFGQRKTALSFLLLWGGIVYFFAGFSTGYLMLLLILMLRALPTTLWSPARVTLVVKNFPDKKGFALGFSGTGVNIGQGVCGLIVGFFLGYISWRTVF